MAEEKTKMATEKKETQKKETAEKEKSADKKVETTENKKEATSEQTQNESDLSKTETKKTETPVNKTNETKTPEKPANKKESKEKTTEPKKELEREYTIPLRKSFQKVPKYKRAKKAVKAIREFLVRHMQIRDRDLNKIKIEQELNEEIWFRGIKKPPAKIKIKATKLDDGTVRVQLAEFPDFVKFKKQRHEKIHQAPEIKKPISKKAEEKKETGEEKTEEQEKEKSTVEAGLAKQKQAAQTAKHTTQGKTKPVQQQRKGTGK